MAVEHMVWIKFHDGISAARIAEHMQNLAGLKDRIPQVKSLRLGRNFTERANGFTHGLIVTLDSPEALDVYLKCDEHVAVATPLKQDAELMAMDFEV